MRRKSDFLTIHIFFKLHILPYKTKWPAVKNYGPFFSYAWVLAVAFVDTFNNLGNSISFKVIKGFFTATS